MGCLRARRGPCGETPHPVPPRSPFAALTGQGGSRRRGARTTNCPLTAGAVRVGPVDLFPAAAPPWRGGWRRPGRAGCGAGVSGLLLEDWRVRSPAVARRYAVVHAEGRAWWALVRLRLCIRPPGFCRAASCPGVASRRLAAAATVRQALVAAPHSRYRPTGVLTDMAINVKRNCRWGLRNHPLPRSGRGTGAAGTRERVRSNFAL